MTDTITILDSDDETPPPSPSPPNNHLTNTNNHNDTLGTASSRHLSLSGDESDTSSHHISTPTPPPDQGEEGANATPILEQGSRLSSANTPSDMSDREASYSKPEAEERGGVAGGSSTRIPDITRKNSNETPSTTAVRQLQASTSHSSTATTSTNEPRASSTSTSANKQKEVAEVVYLDLSDDDDDDEDDDSRRRAGGGEIIELADSSDNEIDNEVTPSASTSTSPAESDSNVEAEPEANLNPKRARSERSKGKGKEMIILGDSSSSDETSTPSSTLRTPRTRRDRHNTQPSTSFSKNLSRPAADVIENSSDESERDERILLPLSEILQKGKGKQKEEIGRSRSKSMSTSIKGSKSPKVGRGTNSPIPGSATPRKTSNSPLVELDTPRATLKANNGTEGRSNSEVQMDLDKTPRAKSIVHRNSLSKSPTSALKTGRTSFQSSHQSQAPTTAPSTSSVSPPLLPNLIAPSHPVSPKSTDPPLPPRKQKIATPEGTPPAFRRRMEVEATTTPKVGGMELEVEAKLGDDEVDRLGGEEELDEGSTGQDQGRKQREVERMELGVVADHEQEVEVEAIRMPTVSESDSGRDEQELEMESGGQAMDTSRSASPSPPIVDLQQESVREDDCEALLKTNSRDSGVERRAEEMEGLHDGSGVSVDDELEVRSRGDAMDISRPTSPSPLADVEEDVILDEADLEPLLISKSSPVPTPVPTINPSSASPLRLSTEASSTEGTNLFESIISLPATFKERSPPTRKEVSRIQFLAQSLAGGLEVIEQYPSTSTTTTVLQESLLPRVEGFGQESLSPAFSSRASTSKSTTPLSPGFSQNSTPGIEMAIMKQLSISSPPAEVSQILSPALSSLSIKATDMAIPRDESMSAGNSPAQESETGNSDLQGLDDSRPATNLNPTEPNAPPVPVVPVRIFRGGRKSTTRKAPRREVPSSPFSSGTDESDSDSESSSGDSVQIIDDYLNAGQQTTGPPAEEEDMVMQSLESVVPSRSPELYAKDQPEDLSDLRALNSPASSSSTTSRSSNGSGTSATRAAKRTAPIVEDLPVKRPKSSPRKIDGAQLRNHRGMKIETKRTTNLVDGIRLVDPLLKRKEDRETLEATERRLEREREENEAKLKDYKRRQELTSCSRRNIAGPSCKSSYFDEFDIGIQCGQMEDTKRPSQPQDTEAFNAMIQESQVLELGHTHGPRIRVVPPESGEGPYSPDFEFVYTNRVIYSQGAEIVPEQSPGCECIGRCQDPINKNKCACLKRQIRACSRVDKGESYSGTKDFAYDERGILREDIRLQEEAIWECNSECGCDDRCQNRNVGKKLGVSVDIYWTETCGWGVRNPSDFDTIPAGTVLGIYAGELLTYTEARDRDEYAFSNFHYDRAHFSNQSLAFRIYLWFGRNYLFDVDNWTIARKTERIKRRERERLAGRKSRQRRKKYQKRKKLLAEAEDMDENEDFQCLYNMDAFSVGNWTRFANHVCEGANTRVHCVYVDEAHYTRPLEVFIAAKDIPSGDPITISYSGEGSLPAGTSLADYKKEAARQRLISKHPCKCGADLCYGYMFKTDDPEGDVSD